jgi:GNS1/SUR4 family
MYSYYTFSTLSLPFAGALKRSMTTAQITQLIVGCFIASLYLFVRYSPVAYTNGSLPSIGDLDGALSNMSLYSSLRDALQNAAANTSDGDSFAAQFAKYAIGKLAQQQQLQKTPTTASPSSTSFNPMTTTMLLRDGMMHAATNGDGLVSCCASTPQAFAVALNVLYLLPLITLFVRFYLRSYSKKGGKSASAPKVALKVEGKSQ